MMTARQVLFFKILNHSSFSDIYFLLNNHKSGGDKEAPFCPVIFKHTPASPMHCNTFVENIVTLS